MDDLPDDPTMRLMAAGEAVAHLGLLKPAAEPTIVRLLENCAGEHPRTVATAWRKAGEQVSAEALIHMSDSPAEIVSDAPSTADPMRSMWQTATLSIRLIVEMDWALRDPRAVAMADGIAW